MSFVITDFVFLCEKLSASAKAPLRRRCVLRG